MKRCILGDFIDAACICSVRAGADYLRQGAVLGVNNRLTNLFAALHEESQDLIVARSHGTAPVRKPITIGWYHSR
jgi:hypothetical protein